jgi:AraC family transcriptional activator of tynA and feaB
MKTQVLPQVASVLDLSSVAEDRRAGLWALTAPTVFPGLSIHDMPAAAPVGRIRSIPMGSGSLWSILSAPALVNYSPAAGLDDSLTSISLVLQLDGTMSVGQGHRACELKAGDMCLIDERYPFHLEGHECNEIVFLRMPRRAVLGRHPYLDHHTASLLGGDDPGVLLLRDTMIRIVQTAPDLDEEQRSAVLSAMVHMLGAAASTRSALALDGNWRVRAAVGFIELNLSDGDLTADRVAQVQGISRRRLDQVLRDALGVSVTGRIWNRRLEQAAANLVDPRYRSQSVSQIAFGVGFEDAAHFSRAFKARFGRSPRDSRGLALAKPH